MEIEKKIVGKIKCRIAFACLLLFELMMEVLFLAFPLATISIYLIDKFTVLTIYYNYMSYTVIIFAALVWAWYTKITPFIDFEVK